MRNAQISRKTAETDITLSLDLDGGARAIDTGPGFWTHCWNCSPYIRVTVLRCVA